MAKIVLGIGVSHSPMLSTPPQIWAAMGDEDARSSMLVDRATGTSVGYEALLSAAAARTIDPARLHEQWPQCQAALETLATSIRAAAPDVLVIISADQRELLFDDNMPMLLIYWGDSIRLVPRHLPDDASAIVRAWNWGYGDIEMDLPVNAKLGQHFIDRLVDNSFDVADSRYLRDDLTYGGEIGPVGYMDSALSSPLRRQGIGHGWGCVIRRLLNNQLGLSYELLREANPDIIYLTISG